MPDNTKRPIDHFTWLKFLGLLEQEYQIAIRYPHHVFGEGGVIFDKGSRTRYFKWGIDLLVDHAQTVLRPEVTAVAVAKQSAEAFISGMKSKGAKRGEYLLLLAKISRASCEYTQIPRGQSNEGQLVAHLEMVCSFPRSMPLGLPSEDTQDEAGIKADELEVRLEKEKLDIEKHGG